MKAEENKKIKDRKQEDKTQKDKILAVSYTHLTLPTTP